MKRFYIHLISLVLLLTFHFSLSQKRESQPPITPTAQNMRAGAFIDVNAAGYPESNYTIENLIKNVLINGGSDCDVNVSNVVVSPNLAASSPTRSWGYFNKGTTNFPFDAGVLLITGRADTVGNTLQTATLSGALGTNGDVDLANAIGVASTSLNDVTYIEFDFVPISSEISFNYIFASEEYVPNSAFPCNYTDGFALLLKKQGDPDYTNLAVLPNGGGPVNVTNIHPANNSCGAINEQYFGGFNNANIETNFNGRTVPLTATATVIPGETYHFKMVLADQSDTSYDSGVFLQAGSFNIGVQFTDGNGVELGGDISICENSPQTLTAQVDATGATFQWFLNGTAIAGATSNTYIANVAGTYSVEVVTPGSTCATTAEIVISVLPLPEANDASLSACSGGTTTTFNLTTAQADISTTAGATFTFYENETDANAGNTNSIANPSAYTSGNTTIYVLVSNGTCSDVAALQLNISETPETPTINTSSNVICGDESVTLTSSATTGNSWSNGETTQSITITEGGTYTLTVTNGGCTSETASVTITKTENPNLQITGNTSFCEGESTTLTATANGTGNTFLWSDGTTTAENTINTAGTYTVTVTTSTGCEFQESITITENPLPVVQNTSLSECSTNTTATFDLTAAENSISTTTGATFTYYTNQADANAGNTNNIATPTAYTSTATTIYVRVSVGDCYQIATLELTITNSPVAEITASSTVICENSSITLTSNFSSGNVWSTGETTQSITVTTAGTYTLSISSGDCTSEEVSIDIEESTNPITNISGDTAFCTGDSTTLTANTSGTGNTFLWSNGETTSSITVNTAGTYTVTVTTSAGCEYQESVTITENPLPVVAITGDLSFCSDASTTLTATSNGAGDTFSWSNGETTSSITVTTAGTYTVTVTSAAGCESQESVTVTTDGVIDVVIADPQEINCNNPTITLDASGSTIESNATIVWTVAGGGNIVSGGDTLTPTVDAAGTYTLTVTSTEGNLCSDTQTVTVVENTTPPTITLSANTLSICEGESLTLTASGGATYTWTGNGTGGNGSTQTVSPTSDTTYTVTGVGANGCQGNTATVNITVVPAIVSTIMDTQFCEGESDVLDAGAGDNYTYLWSTGETTQTITVTEAGIYNVTIDNGVCSETFASTVSYTPLPVIQMVEYNDNTITIILSQNVPNPEFSIDGGLTWQSSPVFVNVSPNVTYHILVREEGVNCYSSTEFYAFNVDNVITPNNDGYNDEIDFSAISKNNQFSVLIYDRYGKVVFRGDVNNDVWKGTYVGFLLPTDTYWYHITWEDPISKTIIKRDGWIMLKNRNE